MCISFHVKASSAISVAHAPIFGVDTAGFVTEWNQMAVRISGWTKEETEGKPLVQTRDASFRFVSIRLVYLPIHIRFVSFRLLRESFRFLLIIQKR